MYIKLCIFIDNMELMAWVMIDCIRKREQKEDMTTSYIYLSHSGLKYVY